MSADTYGNPKLVGGFCIDPDLKSGGIRGEFQFC